MRKVLAMFIISISFVVCLHAQEERRPGGGSPGRGGPPPEAYEACENSDAQSACTVQTPHGELTGTVRRTEGKVVLYVFLKT